MSTQFNCQAFLFQAIQLSQTVLFQTIQVWLFGFYGLSTFVGYLMSNPLL